MYWKVNIKSYFLGKTFVIVMVDWMEYERLAHILWKVHLMSPQETIIVSCSMGLYYIWV